MDVMKAFSKAVETDDAAGKLLIDMVVYNVMADLADDCRGEIAKAYAPWALDRIQVAKRQLGRSYVSKAADGVYPGPEMQQTAEWLAGIEAYIVAAAGPQDVTKALEWFNFGGQRKQRNINRDARGRFAAQISQNTPSKPFKEMSRDRLAPSVRPYVMDNGDLQDDLPAGVDEMSLRVHQRQYDETSRVVNQFKGMIKDPRQADVNVMVQEGNQIKVLGFNLGDFKGRLPEDDRISSTTKILSVELAPTMEASPETANQIAAFNTLSAMGATSLAEMATTDPTRLQALSSELQMKPPTGEQGSFLNNLFGLFRAGGGVLEQMNGYESLGQAARFVGAVGPEAEKVLGPYVRQAAYRFRGTETSPSQALMYSVNGPEMAVVDEYADEPGILRSRVQGEKDMQAKRGQKGAVRAGAMSHTMQGVENALDMGLSGDSLRMQARADIASSSLLKYLPKDPIFAALSEKSGQILPSHGVLFNDNGELISQSVGFTDDHYLPFNLQNLAELRGGSYVRTRVMGGLTGEDIYAAVNTGARQVQVVSGSGVFTLEFAPDFRGARGNSDKARSMYDRYLKILDAVENSGLYLQDVPVSEQLKLREQSRKVMGAGASDQELEADFQSRLEGKRREMTSVTDADSMTAEMDALDALGVGFARSNDEAVNRSNIDAAVASLDVRGRRQFTDLYDDRMEGIRAEKANKLRLNGEGYAAALETLREQFPYFIRRVSYRELSDLNPNQSVKASPKTRRYTKDRGYAAPGGLRADSIEDGFYRTGRVTPRSKRSPEQEAAEVVTDNTPPSGGKATPGQQAEAAPAARQKATSGVAGVAANVSDDLESKANDSIADYVSEITSAVSDDVPLAWAQKAENFTFADVAEKPEDALKWMLGGGDLKQVTEDPDLRDLAVNALKDETAVKRVTSSLINNAGGDDFLGSSGFLDATSMAEAVDVILEMGKDVADRFMMIDPKIQPSDDKVADAFNEEEYPLSFPDVDAISNIEGLNALAQSDPDLYSKAFNLTVDPETEEVMRLPDIREEVMAQLEPAATVYSAFEAVDQGGKPIKMAFGGNTDAWDAFYEDADEVPELTPDNLKIAAGEAMERAGDLQKAWSLAVTMRMLETLEGGVVRPKAEDRLLKPISKALTLPVLTAVLPVVPEDDPLAVEVRKRFESRKPFVPRRMPALSR